jgi:hypothetical protein
MGLAGLKGGASAPSHRPTDREAPPRRPRAAPSRTLFSQSPMQEGVDCSRTSSRPSEGGGEPRLGCAPRRSTPPRIYPPTSEHGPVGRCGVEGWGVSQGSMGEAKAAHERAPPSENSRIRTLRRWEGVRQPRERSLAHARARGPQRGRAGDVPSPPPGQVSAQATFLQGRQDQPARHTGHSLPGQDQLLPGKQAHRPLSGGRSLRPPYQGTQAHTHTHTHHTYIDTDTATNNYISFHHPYTTSIPSHLRVFPYSQIHHHPASLDSPSRPPHTQTHI